MTHLLRLLPATHLTEHGVPGHLAVYFVSKRQVETEEEIAFHPVLVMLWVEKWCTAEAKIHGKRLDKIMLCAIQKEKIFNSGVEEIVRRAYCVRLGRVERLYVCMYVADKKGS